MRTLAIAALLAVCLVVAAPVVHTISIDLRVDSLRGILKTVDNGYIVEMVDGRRLEVVKQEGRVLYFRAPTPPLDWAESIWALHDLREQIVTVRNPTGQVIWHQ